MNDTSSTFTHRIAQESDLPALRAIMARAIGELQDDFLTPEQVAASQHVMGLDTQLVRDGTYFIVECEGQIAGIGGWSYRSTLYGGDASIVAREPEVLDPAVDAARIRAMYTNPDFKRRGVGRMVMALCEGAARAAGFARAELMATAAGVPLYEACGYAPVAGMIHADVGGVQVPLLRMGKALG
ncbi:MAG TPA: GNAT family N-acetyltransferase [Novosphingobium sp.]|nr:GNAT family N-acetyltransferase [Novosphingobium sp.]